MSVTKATQVHEPAYHNKSYLLRLPHDLFFVILKNLDMVALVTVSRSCKKLNKEANHPLLWKRFCEEDDPQIQEVYQGDWKKYYLDSLFNFLRIPFPGKGTIFLADSQNNWTPEYDYFNAKLQRKLTLVTQEKECPIRSISLVGGAKGEYSLVLSLSENHELFEEYLLQLDPSGDLNSCCCFFGEIVRIDDLKWQKKSFLFFTLIFHCPLPNLT